GRLRVEVGPLEGRPDLLRRDLAPAGVGDLLDYAHELDLQAAGQVEVVVGFQDVGDAALPGLAVDADDRLVGPADVVRIDGQIGHLPNAVALRRLADRLHALLDGVLVRPAEGRVDELAGIGMTRVHGQLVALLRHPA